MASGMQWNARSQAAYHGYSHLSGMDTTSWLPGVFAVAVVFPDRPPLTLAEIRPPGTPRNTPPGIGQPPLFSRQRGRISQRRRVKLIRHVSSTTTASCDL